MMLADDLASYIPSLVDLVVDPFILLLLSSLDAHPYAQLAFHKYLPLRARANWLFWAVSSTVSLSYISRDPLITYVRRAGQQDRD